MVNKSQQLVPNIPSSGFCLLNDFTNVKLLDIVSVSTLGVGNFGRVELVRIGNDTTKSYALKKMRKIYVRIIFIDTLITNENW